MKKPLHSILDSAGHWWYLVKGPFVRVQDISIHIKCVDGEWLCLPTWRRIDAHFYHYKKEWIYVKNLRDPEQQLIMEKFIDKYAEYIVHTSFFKEVK